MKNNDDKFFDITIINLPDYYIITRVERVFFKLQKNVIDTSNCATFEILLPLQNSQNESDSDCSSREMINTAKLIITKSTEDDDLTNYIKKLTNVTNVVFCSEGHISNNIFIANNLYIKDASSSDHSNMGPGSFSRDLNNILDMVLKKRKPSKLKSVISSKPGLKFYYELYKDRYPEQLHEWIENRIAEPRNEKVYRFLEMDWSKKELNLPSKEEAYKILDETVGEMKSVKDKIISILEMVRRSGKLSFNILLCGPAGVGKTTIAQAIAKVLNVPMSEIPMAMCQDAETFAGFGATYSNSQEGLFTTRVFEPKYRAADGKVTTVHQMTQVIFLNELDKVYSAGNNHGSVQSTLLRALDDNREFFDIYYETCYPLENAMIIADINDKTLLQKPLLDRFLVIDVDGYTTEEKTHIFNEYIFPKALHYSCVSAEELSVSDEAVALICKNCKTPGVRELIHIADSIIGDYLVNHSGDSNIEYTEDMIHDLIGNKKDSFYFRAC